MSEAKNFLVINPGSTSTKVALYRGIDSWNIEEIESRNLRHSPEDLEGMSEPIEQLELRRNAVEDFLTGSDIRELHAVAGRGGLTRPIEAGSYRVNEALKEDLRSARYGNHASNLGALIADAIASERGIPSLIADPVGVDQFEELARFSGWPGLERKCQLHALNMREVARRAARDLAAEAAEPGEKRSEDMADYRFIIAHLGGGISIGPMAGGRVIDVNNAMDGGPFSPQRVGSLPTTGLIDLCFSGQYASAKELKAAMTRKGGVYAYLGTDDGREIAERIESGDAKAETVFRAMAYQISKEIGAMAAVLEGRVDAILLTGGLPRPPLSDWISRQVGWIAPVRIYPGEMEMLALARAAARHVCEGEALAEYQQF
jgi:butyrate kinase